MSVSWPVLELRMGRLDNLLDTACACENCYEQVPAAREEWHEAWCARENQRANLQVLSLARDQLKVECAKLRAVAKAAKEWIDYLEQAGGHFQDGVPGELMDALEKLEDK